MISKSIKRKKSTGFYVRKSGDNSNTGFQITFNNGYTISIGIGWGHYCDNRIDKDLKLITAGTPNSRNCETAIIKPNGKFLKYKYGRVQSYQTPDEVAETIAYIQTLEPNNYGRVAK